MMARIKYLFYVLLPILLIGCGSPKQVNVDFEIRRLSPLMFAFDNCSSGCDSYRWDFGDGTWSTGTDAKHAYAEPGTYIVTLRAYSDDYAYEKRRQVNVTQPKIYFAGYTLYAIPYENRYYKLVFKDDSWLPSDWDFQTVYTPILTDADMPYTTTWRNPVELEDYTNHEYYTVELIRTTNAANTDNDVTCCTGKIKLSDLLKYNPEITIETTSGSTKFGIKMEYEY